MWEEEGRGSKVGVWWWNEELRLVMVGEVDRRWWPEEIILWRIRTGVNVKNKAKKENNIRCKCEEQSQERE